MEMLENKIIQNKLDSLNTLPEGYTPNLESKWSMLMAVMEVNNKRIVAWKPLVAAALLLILGGAALLMQQLNPQPKIRNYQLQPAAVHYKHNPKPIHRLLSPATVNQKIITHSLSKVSESIKLTDRLDVAISLDEKDAASTELPEKTGQLIVAVPKLKKHYSVEIDFNDAPFSPKINIEPFMASHVLKFTIGLQENIPSTLTNVRPENTFRFQKSF